MDQNGETRLQSHVFCPASLVQTSANCHGLQRHPKPNLSANHVSWFMEMQIPAECSLATNAHKREERKPAAWTSPKKCPENVWFVAAGNWQCQGQVCKCDSSNPAADGLQNCLEESHLFRIYWSLAMHQQYSDWQNCYIISNSGSWSKNSKNAHHTRRPARKSLSSWCSWPWGRKPVWNARRLASGHSVQFSRNRKVATWKVCWNKAEGTIAIKAQGSIKSICP